MSVTVANPLSPPYRRVGNRKETVTNVTMDSSYKSGGEEVTFAQLGFSSFVEPGSIATIKSLKGTVNVASAAYDETKKLLHLYDETPAEVASEANVEGMVIQIVARGI
jgi:hypothetical protein